MFRRALVVFLASLVLNACNGGAGPQAPTPVGPVYSLALVVFLDENGNGLLDPGENGRVPGVTVAVGARTGQTAPLTGQAIVNGVPGGQRTLSVRPETLPPFYAAPEPLQLELPHAGELAVPVTLPIGVNVPNRYMAFGDSITLGDGSSGDRGYEPLLEDLLRMHFGAGEVLNEGIDGTRTNQGADRLRGTLPRLHPAFLLLHYGTNDWNKCDDVPSCFTADSIRDMIQQAKAADTLPVVATIIPVNVGFDARTPPSRNEFVAEQDVLIRAVAAQEGALLVDLEKAFYKAAGDDLSQLFFDHVHPNDFGYQIMAEEFFKALSTPNASLATPASATTLGSSWRAQPAGPRVFAPRLGAGARRREP